MEQGFVRRDKRKEFPAPLAEVIAERAMENDEPRQPEQIGVLHASFDETEEDVLTQAHEERPDIELEAVGAPLSIAGDDPDLTRRSSTARRVPLPGRQA